MAIASRTGERGVCAHPAAATKHLLHTFNRRRFSVFMLMICILCFIYLVNAMIFSGSPFRGTSYYLFFCLCLRVSMMGSLVCRGAAKGNAHYGAEHSLTSVCPNKTRAQSSVRNPLTIGLPKCWYAWRSTTDLWHRAALRRPAHLFRLVLWFLLFVSIDFCW